ncbi:MAG: translation initiation factor [Thermoprotei archaeon ex4572_64]|nr:MAG: translation initiation factor [Thermoprotei archaeon ex4572_64]
MDEKLNNSQFDVVDQLLSSVLEKDSEVLETSIVKEQTVIRIRLEKRKRHNVTIIEIDSGDVKKLDIHNIAKELKRRLAAGGTVHGNVIEIQGDHRYRVKRLLQEMGFKEDNILVDENVTIA